MNQVIHIYLLRGLTRESGHWGSFIELFQQQMPDAVIHLLDLPGSGKYVHEKASVSIARMVDFMRHDFLKEQGEGERIICATSLGGMVASEWVMRHKSDFQGLIIINSSFKKICTTAERVKAGVRRDMVRILFTGNLHKREALIVNVNSNRPEIHAAITAEWVEIQKKRTMSRRNILAQTLAGMLYGVKQRKPEVPLLIFGSKGDRMVCTRCIEKTHAAFGGTLIWHPDSGHALPLDEPQWLGEQIANWLKTGFREERKKTRNAVK
ncbi:MAG: alpha/beta hydrolase [Bacteroidetes bacterium]|nr:alpha/beta hydrolase [Bacteroidota bacterium]